MAGFSGDEKVANSVSSVAYGPCYVNHYYVSDFCDSEEDITESVFDEVIIILLR